jgi:hypothetical protein
MGDANTGRGYGYTTYSLPLELQKSIVAKESNADILARDGFEKVFERFLNAEPPELKTLRTSLQVAGQRSDASRRPEDIAAYNQILQKVTNYDTAPTITPYPSPTPTPDTTPFEKLITGQGSNAEEKEEPKKEKAFESLLNKLNKAQEQEEPTRYPRDRGIMLQEDEQPIRRDAFDRGTSTFGDYTPEEPTRYPRDRGMFQEDEQPIRRDAFGDYTPQEQDQSRDAFGRISALTSNEEEAVQPIPKTKAPDFLEAYKNAIETNSTNNKNEDIAAVYKPSTPTTETWMEKLEKDYERNKNKPVPTNIPYRRGTGLGDHMGADASEVIDAFGRGIMLQEEEEPTRYPRDRGIMLQEDEQPMDAFGRRRIGFDPSEYYA